MLQNLLNNKTRIFKALGLLVAIALTFYLGYSIGNKDMIQSKFVPDIQTVLENGSSENSLTQIQIRDILGSSNGKDKQPFGKFYYVIKNKSTPTTTDILLKIDQAPPKVTSSDQKSVRNVPLEMNVDLAFKTADGLDFEYRNIGKMTFVLDDTKTLKAEFSSILDFTLDDKTDKILQRIVLRPTDPTLVNIFQDTDPNLPVKVRGDKSRGIGGEPAPYFWVEI
jgi:hypothetical protein